MKSTNRQLSSPHLWTLGIKELKSNDKLEKTKKGPCACHQQIYSHHFPPFQCTANYQKAKLFNNLLVCL